jgi:outer membrane lipopolysaccharide assembly protein LptE/RlpB
LRTDLPEHEVVIEATTRIQNAGSLKGSLRFLLLIALTASVLFPVSCGYHRVRPGDNLPDEVRAVSVPVFRNDTFESGIEVLFTDAFREQLIRSGFVRLTDVKHSDAVVVGTIKKFKVSPISFSSDDYAVEYRTSVRLSVKLVGKDGTIYWEDPKVSRVDEFRVTQDIFQSESAKQQATERIAALLMAEVHDRIFDGFDMSNRVQVP